MKYIQKFESMFRVSTEEFDYSKDYYKCNNCNSDFGLYKPKSLKCINCKSKDIILIDKENSNHYEEH